jgi:hypothetical protein
MAATVTLQHPKSKSKKSRVVFKLDLARQYGLKISHRDAVSGPFTECVCRFWVVFGHKSSGRAPVGQSKRRKTSSIQSFSTFRTDLYRQHLSLAHPQKWAAYQALATEAERSTFFVGVVPFREQLQAHFESGGSEMRIHLSAAIVDNVVGDLLFYPDDSEGLTRQRAMALFEPSPDDDYCDEAVCSISTGSGAQALGGLDARQCAATLESESALLRRIPVAFFE